MLTLIHSQGLAFIEGRLYVGLTIFHGIFRLNVGNIGEYFIEYCESHKTLL